MHLDAKVHTTVGFAVVTDGGLDTYAPLTP
ncbi:hypothetical protein SMF913_10101 [Streptomyces malaysiensis]|uniref:Uncharacterized protein n=1 Tax=Streptomyces malaysiensis TaxID=92644 RepID=A0A2J7Z1D4_STRMQ|nr:hypothetical protein SMF913_10101 [Streptomyces malaysiensis]